MNYYYPDDASVIARWQYLVCFCKVCEVEPECVFGSTVEKAEL